jgi:hypothetical protein
MKKEQLIMRIDRNLDAQWQEKTHADDSGKPQSVQPAALLAQVRLAAQTDVQQIR